MGKFLNLTAKRRIVRGVITRNARRSLRQGEITKHEYDGIVRAIKKDGNLDHVFLQARGTGMAHVTFDSERPIIDWITANWAEILKVILSLLPLLLI